MRLFDEVEKAHPDVFNVLLQVLDDGRLTDGQGRVVDFKNTMIVMTSNLPPENLRTHFRPEFLNRIDEIIVFHSLGQEHLEKIVEIQLSGLRARLAERHITLELSAAARAHLVKVGYEPVYGARPLKRAIQRELETPLARLILAGRVTDHHRVLVELNTIAGGLHFETAAELEPAIT